MRTQKNRREASERIQYDTLRAVLHFESKGYDEVPKRYISLRLNCRPAALSKRLERYSYHGWVIITKNGGFKFVKLTEKGLAHLEILSEIFE